MTDKAETKETEVPPGYRLDWKPEEIRTIEPQPLPEWLQEPEPLHPQQQTQFEEIQVYFPHDLVVVEYDDDGWPTFVSPDGEKEEAIEPIDDEEAAQEAADKRRLERSKKQEKKVKEAELEKEKELEAAQKAADAEATKAAKAQADQATKAEAKK